MFEPEKKQPEPNPVTNPSEGDLSSEQIGALRTVSRQRMEESQAKHGNLVTEDDVRGLIAKVQDQKERPQSGND
jgi:hypothetical protein